jgi:hypothetical protein
MSLHSAMTVAGFFALFWALIMPDASNTARLAAGIFGLVVVGIAVVANYDLQ